MRRTPLDGRGEPTEPRNPESTPAEAEAAGPSEALPEGVEAAPEPDYQDRWLRTEAELQNYRRRAAREIEDSRRSAEEAMLLELFPWLDDLERALASAREQGADASWTQGIDLVVQRARELLTRRGVERIDPAGKPFDPSLHEAMLEIDAPKGTAPGTVVQVIHPGYRRGPRVLRAARVVVGRVPQGGEA